MDQGPFWGRMSTRKVLREVSTKSIGWHWVSSIGLFRIYTAALSGAQLRQLILKIHDMNKNNTGCAEVSGSISLGSTKQIKGLGDILV